MKQETIGLNDPRRGNIINLILRRTKRSKAKVRSEREDKGSPGPWSFCIMGQPVPKPRMTDADRRRPRPSASRYFDWCNEIKRWIPVDLPPSCSRLSVTAYLGFPRSYSKALRAKLSGKPHDKKPDASNILKGVEDALFLQDQRIANTSCSKFWEDEQGPRVVITVER